MIKGFLIVVLASLAALSGQAQPLQIGVAHASGAYHLTSKHYMDEGVDAISELGAKCIKVYLTLDDSKPASVVYPHGSEWPACRNLTELADSPPFQRLFARPFETYVMTTFRAGKSASYWKSKMTDQDASEEEKEIYDLACFLLKKYQGTGKTFVLGNWEGDWAVREAFEPKVDPKPEALVNMTKWFQARQRGVDRARADVQAKDVRVLHAIEVCLLRRGWRDGAPCLANLVVPKVAPDLVSYSCWEMQEKPEEMRQALEWLAKLTPDKPPFGDRNIFIGEFGSPENVFPPAKQKSMIEGSLQVAKEFGCPYAIFWAVHCNEVTHQPVKKNDDVKGFGLIRVDGTKSLAWDLLKTALGK